ncbi:SDR family oxidoreductase [Streptomyces sp. GMY02]|uniref:SDR family oxidoreductase n=1 Tax=Streptomyces sp. GMY02 TaxID=1333528 RepID=UPI001C2B8806|nr:SDR family oxidoreductase [Streptomyces sp. GMY02]QXE34224.1 SDR family oxidoreductase [Streptomyces sp. GMY02]
MPRRILVTGAGGMLGAELMTTLSAVGNEVLGWSYSQDHPNCRRMEAGSRRDVEAFFAEQPLDVCVHCVANADVQQCEDDPGMARRVNAETTRIVAEQCARRGVKLVYISTEYVFDGTAPDGYEEKAAPLPLQIYGETKRGGELHTSRVPDHLIVRLPVLYGQRVPGRGPNWTESVLQALRNEVSLELDDRLVRQPTWTSDVARTLERALAADLGGILHVAAQEGVTKYAWGRKIAEAAGLPLSLLRPSRGPRTESGALRPARPWLRTARLERLGIRPPAGVSEQVLPYLRSMGAIGATPAHR